MYRVCVSFFLKTLRHIPLINQFKLYENGHTTKLPKAIII